MASIISTFRFTPRRHRIVGISDGYRTETVLKKIFRTRYHNYHYHQQPHLDITSVPVEFQETATVICCSEVLEHVAPPVNLAFKGLFSILKPGGILVLSVPHSQVGEKHVEHFPILTNVELTNEPKPRLKGLNSEEELLVFSDLTFHGGIGATLEYRIFSEDSLVESLREAGFVRFQKIANHPIFGISWEPWSRVWVAHKPKV